jgi:hypothetical protein
MTTPFERRRIEHKRTVELSRWQDALDDVDRAINELEDEKFEIDEKLAALANDKSWLAEKIITVRGEIAAHDLGNDDNKDAAA